MTVVSNTSPLINLAHLGLLDILHEIYGTVIIPEAVWDEIVVKGAGQPGSTKLPGLPWISTASVVNRNLIQALRQELDAGEAEAIALALETEADLLLMDERMGRETAQHLGLTYIGVIGILVEAKRMGLIMTIQPHLDTLRNQIGFWISDRLYQRVLNDAGELLTNIR